MAYFCEIRIDLKKEAGFRVQGCGGGFAANIYGAMLESLLIAGFPRIVIPSAALDLSCTAGISVYALRENDVLVLPHM